MSYRWNQSHQFVLTILALASGPAVLLGGEKLDPNSHPVKVTHAMELFQQGKLHEAEVEFRALLDADEKAKGLDHSDTLQDRKNLGIILGVEGNFLDAENILHEGIDLETGILGPENKDVLEFREILASTVAREGRNTEAARDFREILAIRERVGKPGDIAVARAKGNLGSVLVDLGEFAEADKLLRSAQPVYEKTLQPNDSAILLNRTNLSKALIGLGRYADAEKEQRLILTALQQFLGTRSPHPEVALAMLNLAATLRVEKKFSEALDFAHQAEMQLSQTLGPGSEKAVEARQLSKELAEAGSKKAAK